VVLKRGRVSAVLPVLTLALALGGCASQSDTPPVQPSPTGDPKVYGPIQVARQGGADWLTSQTAINRQIEAVWAPCMKAAGYDVPPPTPTREQLLADGYHVAYGTDLADPTVRTKEGYGVSSELVGVPSVYAQSAAITAFAKALTDETKRNAFDTMLTTCGDKARSEVLPTAELTQLDNLTANLTSGVNSDPRMVAANAAWVSCMARAGYPFRSTDHPRQDLEARAKPLYKAQKPGLITPAAQQLHTLELAIAAADWSCREQTINPARQTVRNELETQFVKTNAGLVEKVRQAMKAVVARG
jgi:hypothetical protein